MSTFLIILYYATLLGMTAFLFLMLLTVLINIFAKVPFVPTSKRIIRHIAKLAKLKKGERVYDLGCGDGRFLIEAQKYTKVTARGFENAPIPYIWAHMRKWLSGAKMNVSMKNFFHQNLSDADVIYCYLGPDVMTQLGKKFRKECRKGTRIYSNTFSIHGFTPTKVWEKDRPHHLPSVYLYTI